MKSTLHEKEVFVNQGCGPFLMLSGRPEVRHKLQLLLNRKKSDLLRLVVGQDSKKCFQFFHLIKFLHQEQLYEPRVFRTSVCNRLFLSRAQKVPASRHSAARDL